MAAYSVTSATAVSIPGDRNMPTIQNLGPGNLYIDSVAEVTPSSGVEILPGQAFDLPNSGGGVSIWMIGDGNCDVRVFDA